MEGNDVELKVGNPDCFGFSMEGFRQCRNAKAREIFRKHQATGAIPEWGRPWETCLHEGRARNNRYPSDRWSRAVRNTASIILICPIRGIILSQGADPCRAQASLSFRLRGSW